MAKPSSVPRALSLALALSLSPPLYAASDAEVAEIREQLRQIRESYEARLQALELRLKDAEAAKAKETAAAPIPAAAPAATPPVSSAASGIAAFNPAISAVLQGRYANLSQNPEKFTIAGFAPGGDIGPGRRGFSLGESELTISANVDHLFAGNLIVSLTPENTVSVEEVYGVYTAAPYGLVPKFGRFFSGLGYTNEQHQHAWDFIDAPLAYQAFLGGQYANDGLQVKWVAPIDQFLELGAELGNGDNFPGSARNKNGAGSGVIYAHTGGDIGASHSWRAGLSYLQTRAQNRDYSQVDLAGNNAQVGFNGNSHVAIADFIWKYAPNGNAQNTNFKLQAEYFWRRESGDFTYDVDGALGLTNTSAYTSRQTGWYLQGVYQFMPYWRAGARYDRLDPGHVEYGGNAAYLESPAFHPERYSLMVDYTPSEFSRVRLQWGQSKTRAGVTDNQLFLQYILTLGAHGAHKF
ncbi:MAG: OprO/OprP family phosphate-selective porin [Pseudomonadota bacterium]|nr:OprO/OprP family phosphate-selective porin [Pseudomonadota bacterium]